MRRKRDYKSIHWLRLVIDAIFLRFLLLVRGRVNASAAVRAPCSSRPRSFSPNHVHGCRPTGSSAGVSLWFQEGMDLGGLEMEGVAGLKHVALAGNLGPVNRALRSP